MIPHAFPPGPGQQKKERILVVDDEPLVREYLRRCLATESYECDTAADPEEAWRLLKTLGYPLVLCDIEMGKVSGIDLLRRIRDRFRDEVAVIMVTGVDDRHTAIHTLELGAYAYLTKPLDPNEAVIHVVNALERRRLVLQSNRFQAHLQEDIREAQAEIGWRLLAAVGWRDNETGAHIRRVGRASRATAALLGWERDRLAHLEIAAAMHDIGKIGVPDSILLKPGPLTDSEIEEMQRHTIIGANMLNGSSNPMLKLAEEIARSHHEHWDGEGYPDGLRGEEIPESARIVAVADVYDALTSDRPYRAAFTGDEALEMMTRNRGSHFDPRVFDALVDALPEIHRSDGSAPPAVTAAQASLLGNEGRRPAQRAPGSRRGEYRHDRD